MDVLCVDKTGTITLNQLAVTGVIPLGQAMEADVLFAGALASQEANQDPIDLAVLHKPLVERAAELACRVHRDEVLHRDHGGHAGRHQLGAEADKRIG